ncbi:MAG: SRPBCC domain-containing protein [Fimbriimonadaceae bacterium]
MIREKIQIVREFQFPVTTIYHAFTNSEFLKKWLAPTGFSCPNIVFELKVGGRTHTHFIDSDGNSAISEGIFTKVVPNSLIEYDFQVGYLDQEIKGLTTQIIFEPTESGTLVTVELQVPGKEFAAGCIIGWNQSMDNLESALDSSKKT